MCIIHVFLLQVFKVDATSQYTQKIAENFGLTVSKSVRYSDFKDENGKSLYKTESPHDFYKVMLKLLPAKIDKDNRA